MFIVDGFVIMLINFFYSIWCYYFLVCKLFCLACCFDLMTSSGAFVAWVTIGGIAFGGCCFWDLHIGYGLWWMLCALPIWLFALIYLLLAWAGVSLTCFACFRVCVWVASYLIVLLGLD